MRALLLALLLVAGCGRERVIQSIPDAFPDLFDCGRGAGRSGKCRCCAFFNGPGEDLGPRSNFCDLPNDWIERCDACLEWEATTGGAGPVPSTDIASCVDPAG